MIDSLIGYSPFVWAPIDVSCGANDFRRKGPKGNFTLLRGKKGGWSRCFEATSFFLDLVSLLLRLVVESFLVFSTETRSSH